MVKYKSKGNLPQTADYYALLNRSDADWRDSVRQGLVFSSAGAGCLNYGVRNLITGSTTKMRWQFRLNTVAGAGTGRHICSEYHTSGSKRSWDWHIKSNNRFSVLIGADGGASASVDASPQDSGSNYYSPQTGDLVDIKWESGIVTVLVNNTTTYTLNASATQTVIYNNNSPDLNVGGYLSGSSSSYNGSLCCFKIWVDNILDTDTPKFVAPMGDKTGRDIISGTKPTVVGTVDMTARSDDASFNCDEHPFAIGTTLVGDALGCLNYGVRNLITGSTTKMRWQFRLNTVAGAGSTRHICSEYHTSESKRSWSWYIMPTNRFSVLIGADGGGSASVSASPQDSGSNYYSPQTGDLIDIKWESGIITVLVNNTTTYTLNASATQTVIYNNNSPDLNIGGYQSSTPSSYNGSLCCFKIWVDNIADNDTPKFECDYRGTATDKISGTVPAVVGTMVYVPQIHPRLLDDSGYAGTITGPYEEFQVKHYPNTFTGNWHELTHAYFDKSNTDIWEDFVRESINYISEEPNYWHVSELTQDFIDTYIKAAYADKIFVGLDATDSDYAGAVMVFESGITSDQLKDLNFWRKRKYFPERA